MCASVRIGFQGKASDARVLKELLSPWEISFTSPDHADIMIVCDCEQAIVDKAIIVPHDGSDFIDLLRKQRLKLGLAFNELIEVAVSRQTTLTLSTERLYEYEKNASPMAEENSSAEFVLNGDLLLLKVDVVKEYKRIVNPVFDGKSAVLYRFLTSLPIRYDVAPKKIRDFVMKGKRDERTFNYCDKLPLDALRFIVAKAVERLSGKKLHRRMWKGKTSCYIVTHDVDTRQGLTRASSIKKLEEKYDIESAWYVRTKHYSLDSGTIKDLANHGEVGVHGAQHSGNLVGLPNQKLYQLLYEAKQLLGKISDSPVKGFRSPLLQHNSTIFEQLKKADYSYDTSVPTWEPKHPQTMSPFGIGTVFPLVLSNLVEIPVSTVQDHQLLYVLGFAPKDLQAEWLSEMALIKDLNGCCVFLSHPEYKLFDEHNSVVYEELLNEIKTTRNAWLTTPNQLVHDFERTDD